MSNSSSPPSPGTQWSLPARYLVAVVLLVLAAVGMLLLLPLLQILFLAFLIAFLIYLPTRAIKRRTRLPYGLIIAVFFLALIGLTIYALLTLIPDVLSGFAHLWSSIQLRYEQLATQISTAPAAGNVVTIAGIPIDLSGLMPALQQFVAGQSAGGGTGLPLADITAALGKIMGGLLGVVSNFFGSVAGLVASSFSALIIALFLLIDLPAANGILTDWVPSQYGREVTLLFARLDQIWLRFFKAEVVIGLIIGVGNLIIFLLVGVPHPVPLAIIMGTIGLIPTIGGILAAIPIVIVCLLFGSTVFTGLDPLTFTVIVAILCVVYNQLVYTFISPRISGAAVHIPAAIVVIGVLAALALIGILGALLIVPILGSVRLFVVFALSKLSLRAPFPEEEAPPTEIPGFFSHMLYVKPAHKSDTQ